jgi:hypothetical protein
VVVDLRFFSSGAIIGPREPILDIVPDQADLIVEAKIRADDATRVVVGQKSTVHLNSSLQREKIVLDARVSYISADQTLDRQTGASTFTVQLAVSPSSESLSNGAVKLSSGQPVDVFISGKPRSLIQYLLEPLSAGLDKGMRER